MKRQTISFVCHANFSRLYIGMINNHLFVIIGGSAGKNKQCILPHNLQKNLVSFNLSFVVIGNFSKLNHFSCTEFIECITFQVDPSFVSSIVTHMLINLPRISSASLNLPLFLNSSRSVINSLAPLGKLAFLTLAIPRPKTSSIFNSV